MDTTSPKHYKTCKFILSKPVTTQDGLEKALQESFLGCSLCGGSRMPIALDCLWSSLSIWPFFHCFPPLLWLKWLHTSRSSLFIATSSSLVLWSNSKCPLPWVHPKVFSSLIKRFLNWDDGGGLEPKYCKQCRERSMKTNPSIHK